MSRGAQRPRKEEVKCYVCAAQGPDLLIHRCVDRTERVGRISEPGPVDTIRQQEEHSIVGLDAKRTEAARQSIHERFELCVAHVHARTRRPTRHRQIAKGGEVPVLSYRRTQHVIQACRIRGAGPVPRVALWRGVIHGVRQFHSRCKGRGTPRGGRLNEKKCAHQNVECRHARRWMVLIDKRTLELRSVVHEDTQAWAARRRGSRAVSVSRGRLSQPAYMLLSIPINFY